MLPHSSSSSGGTAGSPDDTSWRLLARARRGDDRALGHLLARYLPRLHRWAHGRLPRWARTMADTTDVIHDVVLRTIRRLDAFEPRGQQALAAYLRQAVRNRIRDEHRRFARRGPHAALPDTLADAAASPLQIAMAGELDARYRAALEQLTVADRELIVAHIELAYSHEQLGCMTGRSANAARMALQRAVRRLAAQMNDA